MCGFNHTFLGSSRSSPPRGVKPRTRSPVDTRTRTTTVSRLARCAARLGLALCLFALSSPPVPAAASGVSTGGMGVTPTLRGGAPSAPRLSIQTTSLLDQRWAHVVRQRSDIGCSAASLATILSYYFDFPSSEDEMIQALHSEALLAPAPDLEADILYRGFNMRHIRNVARKGGLIAQAFHVEVKDLEDVKIPVITRVTIRGYDHFVVFREARNGRVYVADPAFGNTVYTEQDFERMWSGVMLGFLRRSGEPVEEHSLAYADGDRRVVGWRELSRTIGRGLEASTHVAPLPIVRTLSLGQFAVPRIEGLDAAFPTLIFNFREF